MRAAEKASCHVFKLFYVVIHGIFFSYENRVIPPAHPSGSDQTRQMQEGIQNSLFVRDMRLDLFSVWRDRHEPEGIKGLEQRNAVQHWRWILRAENHRVDHRRIEHIARDLRRII